jgi:hypothetical protein
MTNDELAKEIAGYVEQAIRKNRRTEITLIVLLVAFALAGIGLMILAGIKQQGLIGLPGLLCEALLAVPIRELVKLRRQNIGLLTLPHLIRIADRESGKALVQKLSEVLIRQLEP